MIYILLIAIIIFVLGLFLGFWPKHKWPTGNVVITVLDKPWYLYWNSNAWWYLNMDNCYGMTPHDWQHNYKAKGDRKKKYHDYAICTKCGKGWGFGTH